MAQDTFELHKSDLRLKQNGQLLVFFAEVDYRPDLIERAIVCFETEQSTWLLCSLYRDPYAYVKHLAGWKLSYFPEEDYSGKVYEIGWRSYVKQPSFLDLQQFIRDVNLNLNERTEIVADRRYKFLVKYQNKEVLARLFKAESPQLFGDD